MRDEKWQVGGDGITWIGATKRSCGKVYCAKGNIDFDGQIDGSIRVVIHCGFDAAKTIIRGAMRAMSASEKKKRPRKREK